MMNIFGIDITSLLLRIPALILALTFHEVAHGYIAMKLGDPTARNFGRLSLNPLKHIDPIGVVCMLLFRFGWAKPVPVNSRYFKKPRRDMALTALAGPVANFILAFVGLLLWNAFLALFFALPEPTGYLLNVETATLSILSEIVVLNISLGVFNLIPVPPLDGSRIFLTFLPPKLYFGVMKYERYIMLGLFVLLYVGFLDGILSWCVSRLLNGMIWVVNLIPFFG